MSSNVSNDAGSNSATPQPAPSQPIPFFRRPRAASVASASSTSSVNPPTLSSSMSSMSSASPQSPQLPTTRTGPSVSPATSPILSYFFSPSGQAVSSSPTKTPLSAFPFGRATGTGSLSSAAVLEDEEDTPPLSATSTTHARSVSASAATWTAGTRFATNTTTTADGQERGAGLLRRLSLGAAFTRPTVPAPASPETHVNSNGGGNGNGNGIRLKQPVPRSQRAGSLSVPGEVKPRAPSPMGERMLKGHFDGFI